MAKIYYNQMDSRWANHPYPAPGYEDKTCGTSGCGTTCGAMIVSSCRETITPDVMCDISRENGYRVPGGTADGLFSYIAERWGIEMKTLHSSYEAHQACKEGYFVVICCASGLWTTGGHFILAVGANDTDIEIYDPYLYNGKFDRPGRQGKVRLDGVSAWVEINTFKANSNAQRFYAFKVNDGQEVEPVQPTIPQPKTAWVNTSSMPLNVRNSANGTIIGSVAKGTKVTVYEESNGWSRIDQGWVASSYLTYSEPVSVVNTVGQTRKFAGTTKIYSNSNLTGIEYDYKANTSVEILENVNSNVDKIKVTQTGRIGYVSTSVYVGGSSTSATKPVSAPVISKYKLGRYKVAAKELNVRTGAGTNYPVKRTYKNGTVFDTYQIKGNWAKTPSGWVCLDYCTLMYKY
jgi:uncharacterized protein YgiM (DUF1202 family)